MSGSNLFHRPKVPVPGRIPRTFRIFVTGILTLTCVSSGRAQNVNKVSLKDECLKTMRVLVDSLMQLQVVETEGGNQGALSCPSCKMLHTRAAEAVFPFAMAFQHSGDSRYSAAAKNLGNWLIRQQHSDGSWQETPEEWTGTSTDQLLMLALAYRKLQPVLSRQEVEAWGLSIRKSADYLTRVMNPEFASINYCTTTTASLAVAYRLFPNPAYLAKARELARQVQSKMDEDGFINAEGERVYNIKYGSDPGYEIDMSLWGLEIYARLTDDRNMHEAVSASLRNHLYLVYPNGVIDGSWGIRSNKWTTYGSLTADGSQILFSLFAQEDGRYRTAGMRNLEYLRTMIKNGFIGYGPEYFTIFHEPPCIYPTFARAKNLALASELGEQEPGTLPPLPTEEVNWAKLFPTVNVAMVRTENMLATVTGYGYKDLQKTYKSKYMHRPTGGAISCLWVKDHGLFQVASQTEYNRWEPMHFPEVKGIGCLTPRIEFRDHDGYFTNLYEFSARLLLQEMRPGYRISSAGELSDKNLLPGGVAYRLIHDFGANELRKTVLVRYHGKKPPIDIVEPIVWMEGMRWNRLDDRRLHIVGARREFLFELTEGNARLEVSGSGANLVNVFPSMKCLPIFIRVSSPAAALLAKVVYRIAVTSPL